MKALKSWWNKKIDAFKMNLVRRWTEPKGLTVVCIVRKAGTDYLVANDGSFHRIGRKQKAAA